MSATDDGPATSRHATGLHAAGRTAAARAVMLAALLLGGALVVLGQAVTTVTGAPTAAHTATAGPTATVSPTLTMSPTVTATPVVTATVTATATLAATPTSVLTPTATSIATATSVVTATATSTATSVVTATATATSGPVVTATPTITASSTTATPAPTVPTATAAPTATRPVGAKAYLPLALHVARYPRPLLAARVWQAAERMAEAYAPAEIYPGYGTDVAPSLARARANVDAACHDFPDLSEPFGAGAHHRACYEWVAAYLGLFHATRAWHAGAAADPADLAWADHYLELELDHLTLFVYGPADSPTGESHRDTLAAIWQNPMRARLLALTADLLRRQEALRPEARARLEELLSGVVRAWYAEFWKTGLHPTSGGSLTTRTAPSSPAYSLGGRQVVSTEPWTFEWDADKGNTPAEEVAWMGAGVMLAQRVLAPRLPEAEGRRLYGAARHYVDYAVAYDRPDPVHGLTVRTLNAEDAGGAYGQNRYWLENHTPDVPSLPYLGYTWQSIGLALVASDLGRQTPWPELAGDGAAWRLMKDSAEATLHAPDGTLLVDLRPGHGIGYNIDPFPRWGMPCGEWRQGSHYPRYDGRAGGPELWVAEVGHPAGLDVLAAAWPLMRMAAHHDDGAYYARWEARLDAVLDAYTAQPPNPAWTVCNVAPYASDNPGYHWARMMSVYVVAYLGVAGYTVPAWTP